jgi:hypothetical protein
MLLLNIGKILQTPFERANKTRILFRMTFLICWLLCGLFFTYFIIKHNGDFNGQLRSKDLGFVVFLIVLPPISLLYMSVTFYENYLGDEGKNKVLLDLNKKEEK